MAVDVLTNDLILSIFSEEPIGFLNGQGIGNDSKASGLGGWKDGVVTNRHDH